MAPLILWFRRDLRLDDNPMLAAAAQSGRPLVAVFIADETVTGIGAAPRWRWGEGLAVFAEALKRRGLPLILRRGDAAKVLRKLITETGAQGVWWSRLYDGQSRARDSAGNDGLPPIPGRAVIADVFLRFLACPRGYTPSFADGPFAALDAVATSRLRDAYELQLVLRPDLTEGPGSLPDRGPDFDAIADDSDRVAAMQEAVLDAWPVRGRAGAPNELPPLQEHPVGIDPTAQFLARIAIPVDGANPPARDGLAVVVDNAARRFVPSSQLIQRWVGL